MADSKRSFITGGDIRTMILTMVGVILASFLVAFVPQLRPQG